MTHSVVKNSPNADDIVVIVITGPVGSGKSTTAWALHDVLAEERIATAMVDMDYLRCAWPVDPPFNVRLGYDNFAAIAINHIKHGVRIFVVADVVESPEQRAEYEQAVPGAQVIIVRLEVPLPVIEQRLRIREKAESLEWHLARAPQLQEILIANGVGDVVIDVDELTPDQLAREIFDQLGLGGRSRLDA